MYALMGANHAIDTAMENYKVAWRTGNTAQEKAWNERLGILYGEREIIKAEIAKLDGRT